ncbi:MAG: LuxR C-terminal-related transcriptional regulator [Anaerolineales bacterium]|nr:LuxR C-terminal-related transcriptional regulator [Anaerolineales bacterium]
MSIWDRFLYLIGLRQTSGPRTYHVDVSDSFQVMLSTLASDEGRPEHELIPELLNTGLTQYTSNDRLFKKWEALSPHEKEVAALVCLGHTNHEIAACLNISPETVKDRLETALRKFHLTKHKELRVLLANWDFSKFEHQK